MIADSQYLIETLQLYKLLSIWYCLQYSGNPMQSQPSFEYYSISRLPLCMK